MSIFEKLSTVIKEVFWIKPSKKKKKAPFRKKPALKKPAKKASASPKPNKPKREIPLKAVKKPDQPKPVTKPKKPLLDPQLVKVGEITHYFERIKVCVVKITQGTVLIGDKLTIVGPKSKFVQKVWSMQIESQDVKVAKKGQLIGVKVDKPTAVGDIVYK